MSLTTLEFQSFVGVDLHKCTVTLAAVSPAGEAIACLKISTKSVEKIEHWLLSLPRPSHLAVEACPSPRCLQVRPPNQAHIAIPSERG